MSPSKKLPRSFYLCDGISLAKKLLGQVLVHCSPEGTAAGIIVETEAYMGPGDRASHSHSGIPTKRTQIAYGIGGHAYMYLIYGMYHCFNIVANKENTPQVVLVRALEPVDGISLMEKRRNLQDKSRLCKGPGCLTRALGLTMGAYGLDLCADTLYLRSGTSPLPDQIAATPRINIDSAGEAAAYPWRFILKGSPYVSGKK